MGVETRKHVNTHHLSSLVAIGSIETNTLSELGDELEQARRRSVRRGRTKGVVCGYLDVSNGVFYGMLSVSCGRWKDNNNAHRGCLCTQTQ